MEIYPNEREDYASYFKTAMGRRPDSGVDIGRAVQIVADATGRLGR